MPIAGASTVRVFGTVLWLVSLASQSGCVVASQVDPTSSAGAGAGAGTGGNSGAGAGGNAGSGAGGNSSTAGNGGGGASGSLIRWCDAYQVINCSCQQCHQDPTRNGAAMPLMTYEDTQRPFPRTDSPKKVWQQMEQSVLNGSMPFTADSSLVPPAQPLTNAQRATLLGWLAEGARDEGGRQCTATCSWP